MSDVVLTRVTEVVDLQALTRRMALISNSPVHVNGAYKLPTDASATT